MIIVIADDITGAAEIAGIGLRFGLNVNLITDFNELPKSDLLVCATDTRSMSEEEAVKETLKLTNQIKKIDSSYILYKKTDSALRGHIIAELKAITDDLKYKHTVLIPQNPSRGRIIKGGVYYIHNQLLHETTFAFDPEYPCHTSSVKELLDNEIEIVSDPESVNDHTICVPNISSTKDIKTLISPSKKGILYAGGADFFTACMEEWGFIEQPSGSAFHKLPDKNVVIICGSTVKHGITNYNYIKRNNFPLCNIPAEVFQGENEENWIKQLTKTYNEYRSAVITIDHPSKGGKEFALRLRNIIANAVSRLIHSHIPQEIIIEGGATAYTILKRLNWNTFVLVNEIEPGIIRMSIPNIPDTCVTIKPGSYEWGEKLFG